MEQNETKRGAHWPFFIPKNTPFFAINIDWTSTYEYINLLLDPLRAPRSFVK